MKAQNILTPKKAVSIISNGGRVNWKLDGTYNHDGYVFMEKHRVMVKVSGSNIVKHFKGCWNILKEVKYSF